MKVTILQMNILAKDLCDKKSFPFVNEEYLNWEHRKDLYKTLFLEKEKEKDFYCLEEVDYIDEIYNIFNTNNEKNNYNYVYYPKDNTSAPGGQAIIYNNNKFRLLYERKQSFSSYNQFVLVSKFEDILNKNTFFILVLHLKAKEDYENIRKVQVEELINVIKELILSHNCVDMIVTGDFNSKPNTETMCLIRDFLIEDKIFFKSVVDLNEVVNKSLFSSIKKRDKIYSYFIDYIFYSDRFKLLNTHMALSNLSYDDFVLMNFLPSKEYPSDHLYVCSEFEL